LRGRRREAVTRAIRGTYDRDAHSEEVAYAPAVLAGLSNSNTGTPSATASFSMLSREMFRA
jgi:hypothetical protein